MTPHQDLVDSIRVQLNQLEARLQQSEAAQENRPLASAVRSLVLDTARRDPRLTRRDTQFQQANLRVLEAVVSELHWEAFRPVKLGWLAQRISRTKSVTFRRLRTLVELGYLEAVIKEGQTGLYRLALPSAEMVATD